MALLQADLDQIQHLIQQAQAPQPAPPMVPVVPVAPTPHANTTLDNVAYVILGLLASANTIIGTFNLNKTPAPPVTPPAVVTPVVPDQTQVKLVSDVADLQARVKVLETPAGKK